MQSDNTSRVRWEYGSGFTFERDPQLHIPLQIKRRMLPHEFLLSQPSVFALPMWNVNVCEAGSTNTFLADVSVDLHVLRDLINRGCSIPGRRVLLESLRTLRNCVSSYDGFESVKNSTLRYLWPNDEERKMQTINDVKMIASRSSHTHNVDVDVDVKHLIHTSLYESQRRAVHRMLELERGREIKVLRKGYMVMAVDDVNVVVSDTDRFVSDNFELDVNINGGYLTDEMGSGKTLTMISLCELSGTKTITPHDFKTPRGTLVACPSQVVLHWRDELLKHVKRPLKIIILATKRDLDITYSDISSADYVIVSFSLFCNPAFREFAEIYSPLHPFHVRCETLSAELDNMKLSELWTQKNPSLFWFHWRRFIVDEFHEIDGLTQGYVSQSVMAVNAHSKWMMSGSPFMNSVSMVRNVRQFLWPEGWPSYDMMIDVAYHHVIRSGTKIKLPALREDVVWVNMSPVERAIYEGMASQGRAQQLRCCAYAGITALVQNSTTTVASIEEMRKVVREAMELELSQCRAKVRLYRSRLEQQPNSAHSGRIRQFAREAVDTCQKLEARVAAIEDSLRYLQSNDIHGGQCTICLEQMHKMAVLQVCGHAYCHGCITQWLKSSSRCPTCRTQVPRDQSMVVLHESLSTSDDMAHMVSRYGSKLASIIKYVESVKAKVILFSQWDDLLHRVGSLINNVMPVLYCRGSVQQRQKSIERFRNDSDYNIILLSTLNSGSGCDLSVAHHVIMLDVLDGSAEYVVSIEKQALSRCYRVGQTRDVKMVRFLCSNTIESDLYNTHYRSIKYESFYDAS